MRTKPLVGISGGTRIGSKTATMLPIVGCLARAEEIVGAHPRWSPVNEEQRAFLSAVFPGARGCRENTRARTPQGNSSAVCKDRRQRG